jgi:uncharacterized protein (DUF2062 family)
VIRKFLLRAWHPIQHALKQGMTPRKLALTCALGAVIAVFPVYGSTTLICFLVAVALRLNVVVIQAVNWLLAPLQLALIIPFMQGGIYLFSLKPVELDIAVIQQRFQQHWLEMLKELGGVIGGSIAVWSLISVPLFLLLFVVFHILFSYWLRNQHTNA